MQVQVPLKEEDVSRGDHMLETAEREPGPYVVRHGYGRQHCETKGRGRLNGVGTYARTRWYDARRRPCRGGGVTAPSSHVRQLIAVVETIEDDVA